MNNENIKKMKEMSRDDLECLITSFKDDLDKKDRFIKHIETENERLSNNISEMYLDIKLKTLRFFIDAKPTDEQRDIFANLFENYLK